MIFKGFEVIFKVTETCQNGKERRIKKTVYSPCFGDDGKFIVLDDRKEMCIKILKELGYYDIEYLGIKTKALLFTH